MQYLLLSCSNKKNKYDTPVAAIDLYNGVFFSVYRKALRNNPKLASCVKLIIISAKYGLIEDTDILSFYDQKMSLENANQQRKENTEKLKALIIRDKPQSLTAIMGRTYLQSIDLSDIPIPTEIINGEIGVMLHNLKVWLNTVTEE